MKESKSFTPVPKEILGLIELFAKTPEKGKFSYLFDDSLAKLLQEVPYYESRNSPIFSREKQIFAPKDQEIISEYVIFSLKEHKIDWLKLILLEEGQNYIRWITFSFRSGLRFLAIEQVPCIKKDEAIERKEDEALQVTITDTEINPQEALDKLIEIK